MERLKKRSQFQAVLAGRIIARTPHFALHFLEVNSHQRTEAASVDVDSVVPSVFPDFSGNCIGALLPKRWARHAVTRNAIRRQIYQVSATVAPHALPSAYVVRLRATFDRSRFICASSQVLKLAVREEITQLFAQVSMRSEVV